MTAPFSVSWLIEALVASTVLMLVVLALRSTVRKAFGAQVAYAMWLLPIIRLLLPPLPANWHAAAIAPVQRATEQVTILFVDPVGEAAAPSFPLLGATLALLWIVGAALFIGWHTLAHRRFCRRMLDQVAAREELDGVHVIETDAASGPLAFGIWRRYVAFPRDFAERYDADERDLALAHELGHHARGDLIANWVALFVLALHWFNPVAWRAFRAFRADQEIANDARVLAGMNPMRRHTYACAILKAAHPTFLGGTVSATCHLHTIDDLKGRLRMLTTTKMSRLRVATGAGALLLIGTAGLGLTASGTAAAARVRTSVESATGVTLASLDQAAAPVAAPAPSVSPAPEELPAPPPPPAAVQARTQTVMMLPDGADDKKHRQVIRIVRRGDGKDMTEAFAGMPEISSTTCKPDGDDKQMVKTFEKNGKKIMIICSNRIAKVAAEGAAMAANSKDIERNAYVQALTGLLKARAEMVAHTSESDQKSVLALPAIDKAIAELESNLAKVE